MVHFGYRFSCLVSLQPETMFAKRLSEQPQTGKRKAVTLVSYGACEEIKKIPQLVTVAGFEMVEHSSPNATQSLPLEFDCDNAITDLASSTRDRTCEMPSSRGHPLLKKASFAIYADHFKRWRTDDYQCSQSSSQSPRRPSRQSSQSQPQPRDRLLRRDEQPDFLL